MKSFNKRIDDLGDHLSPTDIVLRWLQENLRSTSMDELVAELSTKPYSAWPLFRLPKEAEQAAQASMPDMPQDKINARVREYVRDVVFLWRLHYRVNARIDDELRSADALILLFSSKRRSQSRERARLSGALDACRDVAYPLDAETAAAVEAAIKHRAVSWNDLRDDRIIKDWVLDDPETDEISTDKQAAIVRGVEHELRSLVRPNLIRSGKLVSLPTSPLPFLKVAPLLDGRWVDTAILELAELGVILTDSGFTPGKSRDPHPVAWEEFVQTDSRGAPTPVDDAAWHKARRAAAVRIRAYRGRRRVIEGRDYVEFALYQRSRKHSLDNRLDASTESGFVVADWNDWVKNQGPAAALAGIAVRPIDSRVDAEAWTVHHADRARRLQAARANLVGKLRPSELEERKAAAGVEARICTRDNAVDVLVPVEGFVRAVDRIRARYFKNHEIVYPNHLDHLDACRYGIHSVLVDFEEQRGGDDSWIARLTDPSLPVEGEPTDSDYVDHQKRVQERINHAARNAVRGLVHQAHFKALDFVGEFQLPLNRL